MTVVCITLNPAEDRVARIDSWPPEGTIRPLEVYGSAGGKGINVARALHTMGHRVITTGLCGGVRGEWLTNELHREGLNPSFTSIASETRVTYTLAGPDGETTVVAEDGPRISVREFQGFLAHLRGSLLPAATWVIASGSLPTPLTRDAMTELVDVVHAAGKRILVDTSGPALQVEADVVKANLDETREVGLGTTAEGAARALVASGARLAMITDGPRGALLTDGSRMVSRTPPRVDVVSTVGAGDVATAGLVSSLLRGASIEEALEVAVVAGAAACLDPRAGHYDRGFFSRHTKARFH